MFNSSEGPFQDLRSVMLYLTATITVPEPASFPCEPSPDISTEITSSESSKITTAGSFSNSFLVSSSFAKM